MKFALSILLFFCQLSLWAQAIDLNVHDPQQRIGKSITYFEDKTSILSVLDLQQMYEKGQCLHGSSPILNFGNTSSAIWIHIPLKSSVNAIDYLIIDNANIEQVDLYIPASNGWNTLTAGSLTKPTSGVRSTFQYIFPLQLSKPNIITNVWLRVKSRNIMLVPLKLARADNLYLIENETPKIIELCFIGFLSALLVFHLFLYLSIKDAAYLYYCLYICSLGIYTIGYLGGYSYLLGNSFRSFLYQYPHLFFCAGFIASIITTNRFFNLRFISRPLYKWTKLLVIGLSILMLISILGYKALAASVAQIFGLLVPLTLAVTSLYAYKVARRAAIYLSAAWLTFAGSVVYYVLSLQGIIAYQSYSRSILQGGVLSEFMLLAIALGQRYQSILKRQREMEAENLKLIQKHNSELEHQVAKRTENLKEAFIKLKASDEIKNKLFSIIAHDLRTPFNSILTILSRDNIDLLSEEELKFILRSNSNHFQQLKMMLDNILHWARSQMDNVQIKKQRFELTEMIHLLTAVYKPIVEQKKIRMDIETSSEQIYAIADKDHIQLVVRNLLDNAVKFTNPSGNILMSVTKDNQNVCFEIQNDFVPRLKAGLDEHDVEISNDIKGEKGVGIGIDLCEDYLSKNKSSLKRKMTGKRIGFSFELPLNV